MPSDNNSLNPNPKNQKESGILDPINKFLDKPMTRQKFMAHLALSAVSIMGINALIQSLTNPTHHKNKSNDPSVSSNKFGRGSYGN